MNRIEYFGEDGPYIDESATYEDPLDVRNFIESHIATRCAECSRLFYRSASQPRLCGRHS